MSFLAVLRTLCVGLTFAVVATVASGQSYPEYDGAYLKMVDGAFVELPTSKLDQRSRSAQFHRGGMHTNAVDSAFFVYEDFSDFPTVDIKKFESVVVVGPDVNAIAIHSLVEAKFLYRDFYNDPATTATYIHGDRQEEVFASELPDLFARQPCGFAAERFRVKRIGDFVVEFSIRPEFRVSDGTSFDGYAYFPVGDNSCKRSSYQAVAFEILVVGKYRASFRNKKGVDSYLFRSSMREESDTTSGSVSTPKGSSSMKSQNFYDFPNGYFQPSKVRCSGDTLEQGIEMDPLSKSVKFYSFACTAVEVGINASGEMNWKLSCYSDEGGQSSVFERSLRLKVSSEDRIYVNGQPFKRCYLK